MTLGVNMTPDGYFDNSLRVVYFLMNGSFVGVSKSGRSSFGSCPLLLTWVDGCTFSSLSSYSGI